MSRLKTDAIRNVNASVDGITLDTSGNVAIPNKIGIDETSPQEKLHVGAGGKIRFERSDGTRYGELFNNNNFVELGASTDPIRLNAQSYIRFDIASNEKVRITSDGKIGINRTAPTAPITARRTDAGGTGTSGVIAEFANSSGYGVWFGQSSASGASWGATTGDFYWNTGGLSSQVERLRIGSTGNVAIGGNTSVGTKLHIENSSGDAHIRLRGSVNYGVLFTRHSDAALVGFVGSGGSVNLGTSNLGITAGLSGGHIVFQTGGTAASNERVRINSAGDTMFGCTVSRPAEFAHPDGFSIRIDGSKGQFQSTVDANPCGFLNRDSSDGNILSFRREGADVGHIGVTGTTTYLQFGGTNSAAHQLDDYEEGVHTQTSVNANLTLTNNILRYTKIGRLVTVSGMLKPSAVSSSNAVQITLPFTSVADSGATCGRYTSGLMHKYVNVDNSYKNVIGYIGQNEAYWRIYHVGDNLDWHQLTNNDLSTNSEIFFTFTYHTT